MVIPGTRGKMIKNTGSRYKLKPDGLVVDRVDAIIRVFEMKKSESRGYANLAALPQALAAAGLIQRDLRAQTWVQTMVQAAVQTLKEDDPDRVLVTRLLEGEVGSQQVGVLVMDGWNKNLNLVVELLSSRLEIPGPDLIRYGYYAAWKRAEGTHIPILTFFEGHRPYKAIPGRSAYRRARRLADASPFGEPTLPPLRYSAGDGLFYGLRPHPDDPKTIMLGRTADDRYFSVRGNRCADDDFLLWLP